MLASRTSLVGITHNISRNKSLSSDRCGLYFTCERVTGTQTILKTDTLEILRDTKNICQLGMVFSYNGKRL